MTALALDCAIRSDVGRRPNNEDAWFASTRIAAVADGVGGAAAGEVASRTVINAMIDLDKCRLSTPLDVALAEAVASGNETLGFIAGCRPQYAGMSTTLTAVALSDEGAYVVANVGDSRTYLLRDGALRRLTRDDSLIQELLDRGAITTEEARHHPQRSMVMQALDGDPSRRPVLTHAEGRLGDRLLLCSDGLSDVVADETIAATLTAVPGRREAADALIARALHAGARDNVSVVVADVVARRDASAGWER